VSRDNPIDLEAVDKKKEKIRAFLVDNCDDFERSYAYYYLYIMGERVDGLERRLIRLSPRKAPA
jgi:hypothetical protein